MFGKKAGTDIVELAHNIEQVQERIAQACARAGRAPDEVTLVAVSKTFPAELVAEAYDLGLRDFGENRVEEAEKKISNIKFQMGGLVNRMVLSR